MKHVKLFEGFLNESVNIEALKKNLMAINPDAPYKNALIPGGCYFHVKDTSNAETEKILSDLTGKNIQLDYNGIDRDWAVWFKMDGRKFHSWGSGKSGGMWFEDFEDGWDEDYKDEDVVII